MSEQSIKFLICRISYYEIYIIIPVNNNIIARNFAIVMFCFKDNGKMTVKCMVIGSLGNVHLAVNETTRFFINGKGEIFKKKLVW